MKRRGLALSNRETDINLLFQRKDSDIGSSNKETDTGSLNGETGAGSFKLRDLTFALSMERL